MSLCSHCLDAVATHRCKNCKSAYFCSDKCRVESWEEWHQNDCVKTSLDAAIDDGRSDIEEISAEFSEVKKQTFYKASMKKLRQLRRKNVFAWMCILSYKSTPVINNILFKVNGDLSKIDQNFMGFGPWSRAGPP